MSLDFTFDVGAKERHTVRFVTRPLWGKVQVSVDGALVLKRRPGTQQIDVEVGTDEPHQVSLVISPSQEHLGGRLPPQVVSAYVDGNIVGQ